MLHEDVCVLRMRNVPKFSSSFCVWLISRLIFASQIQKISHHSQWILTMGRISSTPLHSSPGSPSPPPDPSVSSANFSAGWKWCWWWFCGCCRCWWGGNEIFAGGPNKLTILWGPLLSIWEVARSQLEHVSFGLLDGLADHYDDHDEDGQQDEDAAYGHGHHGAVTHAGLFFFSS